MKETSYSLGVLLGENLKSQIDINDLDMESVSKGLVDILSGAELEITMEAANYNAQIYLQQAAAKKASAAQAEEMKFMEENASRPGIVKRDSGLQYEVLVEGTGTIPKATDKVVAHYEGKLLSGKVFDSSYKRGQPATFPVNGLIQGWQEALQIMPVGSKWRLYIPSELGYGARGAGADIPGGATLIFDLELLQIN